MNKATLQQAEPGKPRAEVSNRKKLYAKERNASRMSRSAINQRDAQTGVFVHQPSAVPSGVAVLVAAGGVSVVRRCW